MTNNCTCDPTNVTRTTLESHIGNTTVHVTSEDHTKINKIPELESSLSSIRSRVSSLETNANTAINPEEYITKTELDSIGYITKTSLDMAVDTNINTKLEEYYTKDDIDEGYYTKDNVDEIIQNSGAGSGQITINTSTSNNSRLASLSSFVTGTSDKPVINISIQDNDSVVLANDVVYVNIYTTTDTIDKPSINKRFVDPGTNWSQSIDNTGIYLWSSRGMKKKDGDYVTFADGTYWSDPQFCGAVNDTTSNTGVDTDIFDYIYWITASETGSTTKPAFSVEDAKDAFNKGQYISDKSGTTVRTWNDHPTGVTSSLQYEYCSFAKYDHATSKWGDYSIPFIFSHYGIDGRDGDGVEYVYKLSQSETTPTIQFDNTSPTYQEDDYIPTGWNDNPQSMYDPYLYQYCSVRKKTNGTWGDFASPVLWSVYKKPNDPVDTESILTVYKAGAKDAESSILTESERKSNNIPTGWITTYPTTGKGEYIYQIIAKTVNGIVSLSDNSDEYYWSIPIRITSVDGEKGEPGTSTTGSDGSDIDFVYCRTSNDTRPSTPSFTVDQINKNGSVVVNEYIWTDNPQGVTQEIMYEWISVNTKPAGINTSWSGYTPPVLWSKYGERGADGDTVEYIYKRTSTDTTPDTPVAPIKDPKLDDNFPADWTDNPSGVNLEKPYEWVSLRKKDGADGKWGVYTDPKLWAKYGKDGKDGKDGTSAQGYSLNCDNPHVIVDDDIVTQFGTAADVTYTLTDTTDTSGQYKFEVTVDPSLTGVTCVNTNSQYSDAKTTTLTYTATKKLPIGNYVTTVVVKKKNASDGTETTISTQKQHITVKDFSLGDAYKLNQQTYTLYADADGKLKTTTTIKASYTKITNDGSSLVDCKYRTVDDNKVYFLVYPEMGGSALSSDTITTGTVLSNYYTIILYLVTDSGAITVDSGIIGVSKDGSTGDKGDSAIYLTATPNTLAFAADNNGTHLNNSSSQTVDLVLYNGGTPVEYTNYTLEYRTADHQTWESDYENCTGDITIDDSLESSDNITTSITLSIDSSNWPDDNAWSEYRVTYNGSKYVVRVDWIGHRMGESGKDGLPGTNGKNGAQIVYNIRRFSDCTINTVFKDGTQDEVPCALDVVIDDSGNYYKCIKAYTLTDKSTQGPTNTTYWEKFETFTNIATDLVLTKKAYIQNLLLNYATAVNRATNTTTISIDGDTGVLTANGLQARNATIGGSIEASTIGYSINTPQAVPYKQPTEDNTTWIPATLPNGSGTQCAAQVLACDASVYVMPQVLISSEPDVDDVWEAWSGNCVTYVILPPTKVGKIALDIYFRNEITDWDGYNTDTVYYLAVMNPTISKSQIENGAYTKSVISNLTSYYPSLVDLQSAGSARRVTTKNYMILTEKYNNGDTVACDRPSHIKLMSDGTNWYIVQVDEFDK